MMVIRISPRERLGAVLTRGSSGFFAFPCGSASIRLRQGTGLVAVRLDDSLRRGFGQFRDTYHPVVLSHVNEPHALGIPADLAHVVHFRPEDFSFGGHDHDLIVVTDLME